MLGRGPGKEQHLEGSRDSPHPTAREELRGGAVSNYTYKPIAFQLTDEGMKKKIASAKYIVFP